MKTASKISILAIGLIAVGCLVFLLWLNAEKHTVSHFGCIGNLKAIGVAVRVWGEDHNYHYPWNVSTNQGGTREFCAADKDGFEANSAIHFRVLSNEIVNPIVLVCPQDRSRQPALNFQSLGPANVSYRVRTGTNVDETHPGEILAVCPIDGNTLYCDGSVIGGKSAHK